MTSDFFCHVDIPESGFEIEPEHKVLCIGSCFSDHIGHFFEKNKFNCLTNPLGIVYNPVSIFKLLESAIADQSASHSHLLVNHNDLWHSLMHHGRFSQPDRDVLIRKIDNAASKTRECLLGANYLFITLGSAHAFIHKENGSIVTNCHKIESPLFEKILIGQSQIKTSLDQLYELTIKLNPTLRFVITVSPVRYLRDGLIENNKSKARLIAAAHDFCNTHHEAFYFPAYEIVIDELRDYRFFKDDRAHPTDEAVSYVLSKFTQTMLSNVSRQKVKIMSDLNKSLEHRPHHSKSLEYYRFLKQVLEKMDNISNEFPDIKFAKEREIIGIKLSDFK